MSEISKIINWGEAEMHLLFAQTPKVVKTYEAEVLHIGNIIKAAVVSPTGEAVIALLGQLIPGAWEGVVLDDMSKGLGIALPEITTLENSNGTLIGDAEQVVNFLKGLSPKMQHSGILKIVSSIFQAIDPTISEVGADTAAQLVYAKSAMASTGTAGAN